MQLNRLLSALVVSTICGAVVPAAHAGYTVIEDDLYPTGQAPSRPQLAGQRSIRSNANLEPAFDGGQDRYSIPFVKYRSPLIASAKAKLDELLPYMQGAEIRVVGRTDALTYTSGKLAELSYNRANVIRTYLMSKGIPANAIKIEVDDTPNPQRNGINYPSDIYISRANVEPPVTRDSGSYSPAAQYVMAATKSSPVASPNVSGENQRLIQYINQAMLSGQMAPQVAVKLIQHLMDSSAPATRLAANPSPSNIQVESNPVVKAIAAPIPVQTWSLDKKMTLRENVDSWSKQAGWNPSQWDAANAYQVTVSTTLDGGFPDVLRQVAEATGLNICAKKREKYIRVTDSNVSCK